jgi:Tfp pilus assembly protein PilF
MTPAEQIQVLVRQLHRLGVDETLLGQVEVLLPSNRPSPQQWAEFAASLRRARNYAAADLVYTTAFAIHGGSARLWNNYGVLLRDWGKAKQALVAFDHAILLDPRYAKAIANKANILHRFTEARAWYKAALDIDPSDAGTANNIGVCLLGEGDRSQAEAWFEKALYLNPDWADALFNLVALKLERSDFESARPLVDTLSRLLPDDVEVKRLQARVRNRKG